MRSGQGGYRARRGITRRRFLVLGGAAAVAATAGRPRPAGAQTKEVVLGAVYPVTGPSASTGVDLINGYKLALDVINNPTDLDLPLAKGSGLPNLGGAKLKIIFADHQNLPEKALGETERLITEEKVSAVLGCYVSGVTAPASQVAERHGIPFLDPDAVSPALIRRGFKWFFRITMDDDMFSYGLFRDFFPALEKKRGIKIKNVAILNENTLTGVEMAKYMMEYAPKYGVNIVNHIAYPARTTSVVAETQRLKSVPHDVLVQLSYISEAILFVKTWRELDYNPPAVISEGAYRAPQFLQSVGRDGDGILQKDEFSVDYAKTRPIIKKVNDMFRARFGYDLTTDSSRTFMAAFVISDAINRAKSTRPEAIREALYSTSFPPEQTLTAWNGIKFNKDNGQNDLASFVLTQASQGQWRLAWPFEAAPRELVWPLPKWSERPKS